MTVIGIDLGSHTASIGVWYDDKNLLEVLADDLGFRTIPCVVAFRGEETIVGHSAVAQQHKNATNTFDEVRSLLFNHEQTHCNVPVLEKDLTIEEINSIFFRNIHNQVKQQAGKIIREAVVTVPMPLEEATKKRYIEAAQAGGIRIKSFLVDSTAALLAYGLDDPNNTQASTVLVVDLGWSRCTVTIYHVSNGQIVQLASSSTTEIGGKIFVKALADFCAKEFTRKNKVPVQENKRAMMRLFRECEQAMKSLSTGGEATIDIDSLCEGIDYSSKVSRARFEDLLSIPVIHFKILISQVLQQAKVENSAIHHICLAGGPSSMPKFINTLKALLPHAQFPKVRFETGEAAAIGAAVHGKHLFELGLLDSAPIESPSVKGLSRSISLSNGSESMVVFPAGATLPAQIDLPVQLPSGSLSGCFTVLLNGESAVDSATPLGEVSFTIPEESKEESLTIQLHLEESGSLKVEVLKGSNNEVVTSLTIPVN